MGLLRRIFGGERLGEELDVGAQAARLLGVSAPL